MPKNLTQKLEQLFALSVHQKIQCVGRETASKVEESTSYQVSSPTQCPQRLIGSEIITSCSGSSCGTSDGKAASGTSAPGAV